MNSIVDLINEGFESKDSCDQIERVLKSGEHSYSWNKRVKGDGSYRGFLDRIKLNRAEGYEMVPFIWSVFKGHDELPLTQDNIFALEDKIHEIESVMKEEIHNELDDFIADCE